MTDTKESHWSDRADLRAENARLRAEVERLTAEWQPVAEALSGAGDWRKLGSPVDYVNELRAELAEARKSLDALRAAPSDAEIEEWRRGAATYLAAAWRHIKGDEVGLPEGMPSECRRMLNTAVALMRRATAAPAQSALREAADLRASLGVMHARWMRWRETFAMPDEPDDEAIPRVMREAMKGIDRAAAPEAKEPSGVVVPEDVAPVRNAALRALMAWHAFEGMRYGLGDGENACDSDMFDGLAHAMDSVEKAFASDGEPAASQPAAALDDTRRLERAEHPTDTELDAAAFNAANELTNHDLYDTAALVRLLAHRLVSK